MKYFYEAFGFENEYMLQQKIDQFIVTLKKKGANLVVYRKIATRGAYVFQWSRETYLQNGSQ